MTMFFITGEPVRGGVSLTTSLLDTQHDLNVMLPQSFIPDDANPVFFNGLEYRFTKDPELLDDFIAARKRIYSLRDVTAKSVTANESWDYGLDTNVLTILDNGKCIGGGIVINRKNSTEGEFPFENRSFRLSNHFPQLNLINTPHSLQKTIFVTPHPKYKNCTAMMYIQIYNFCRHNNIRYLFSTPHSVSARRAIRTIHQLKLNIHAKVINHITLPHEERWNGYPRKLFLIDLRSALDDSIF